MEKVRIWLAAARLRTLPLSVSGILTGNALALSHSDFSFPIFYACLFTAISYQILSNFANDYGDGIKKTDNAERVGPKRVLQQGLLRPRTLQKGILITAGLGFVAAVYTIYLAFDSSQFTYILVFSVLALLAIGAAIKYTVGSNAYGYYGWGDAFVFLFFGGVSVLGSFFLQTKTIHLEAVYLALAIGFLSTGVLNVNNMRDRNTDKKAGKNTLVVRMGITTAKGYYFFLIVAAMVATVLGMGIQFPFYENIWVLAFFPIGLHLIKVLLEKKPERLDPQLRLLALSTFMLSILIFITFWWLL